MMPPTNNLLAIEWDRREARYVWATVSGKRLQIRAVGRVVATEPETSGGSDSLTDMLTEIKDKLRLKNPQMMFLLPRAECEEFEATLPPADDHEVAHFVINQAHERWPTVSDDGVIDYYSLEDSLDGTARVSIVLLTAEKKEQYTALGKQVGWKLVGIHLRHLGTVQLWRRLVNLVSHKTSVLLSLSRADADLIVFSGQKISLVRTIPLSTEVDPSALVEKLKLEVQRSLMVTTKPAAAEVSEQPVVYLFGQDADQEAFAEQLRQALSLPVTVLEPLKDLSRSNLDIPDQIHQFAPLLGSLTEATKTDTVNFLKPKCAVSVSPLYRRLAIYGAVALILLGVLIWTGYDEVSQLRNQTQSLNKQLTQTQKKIDDMKERTEVVDYFKEWQRDDINWLEELRELSSRFPERADTQVKNMALSVGPNRRGVISMSLRAKNDQVISRLEQAIRDSFHQIRTNQLSQNSADAEYPWQFGASILVTRRTRDEFATALPPPVSKAATPSESKIEPSLKSPTREEPSRTIEDASQSPAPASTVQEPVATDSQTVDEKEHH